MPINRRTPARLSQFYQVKIMGFERSRSAGEICPKQKRPLWNLNRFWLSKALPDGTFSQKAVIDAHRTITSSNDLRDFTARTIRSSKGKFDACVYTRESVCPEAASFKRASHLEVSAAVPDSLSNRKPYRGEPVVCLDYRKGVGSTQSRKHLKHNSLHACKDCQKSKEVLAEPVEKLRGKAGAESDARRAEEKRVNDRS